jgi:hypothetical protein
MKKKLLKIKISFQSKGTIFLELEIVLKDADNVKLNKIGCG